MSSLREIQCPSCGASQDFKSLVVVQITCEYCESVFLIDVDEIKDTGEKARLIPSISGLAVGAEGKLHDKRFTVLGRIQYGYTDYQDTEDQPTETSQKTRGEIRGKWDEWFIEYDDDRTAWLSEDMGQLILEKKIGKDGEDDDMQASEFSLPNISHKKTQPGYRFAFNNKTFVLREFGEARCLGSQGSLPYKILHGESYHFADATDLAGKQFMTIEFDGEPPTFFIGKRLKSDEISFEAPEMAATSEEGSVIQCPSCGYPNNPLGDAKATLTLVCPSCHSAIDISLGTALAVGRVEASLARVFRFTIGTKGTLKEIEWIVVGRMRYEWRQGRYSGYNLEYLLHNEKAGYRWLAESEEGDYSFGGPVDFAPETCLFDLKKSGNKVKIHEKKYSFLEKGELELIYVDGSLPWRARIGDKAEYAEAKSSKHLFTEEREMRKRGFGEIEYFHSKSISREKTLRAFGTGGN